MAQIRINTMQVWKIGENLNTTKNGDPPRTSAPMVKVNTTVRKHKVWPRQPCCTGWSYRVSALLIQSLGDAAQTGTGKVDPARKFKCTTATRVMKPFHSPQSIIFTILKQRLSLFYLAFYPATIYSQTYFSERAR